MACSACLQALPEGARFCPFCGHQVVATTTEERRLITVLFADIVGYTGLVEYLDPERAKRLLDDAFERLIADVIEFGGTIDKVLGDGHPKCNTLDTVLHGGEGYSESLSVVLIQKYCRVCACVCVCVCVCARACVFDQIDPRNVTNRLFNFKVCRGSLSCLCSLLKTTRYRGEGGTYVACGARKKSFLGKEQSELAHLTTHKPHINHDLCLFCLSNPRALKPAIKSLRTW